MTEKDLPAAMTYEEYEALIGESAVRDRAPRPLTRAAAVFFEEEVARLRAEVEGLLTTATLEDFAEVDEPGADALVGTPDAALIAEGSDVMIYGDGGASKTTLSLDLGCHLASGDDWLGNRVDRPVSVMLIENEGPRPPFRLKLRRKLDGWAGSPLGDRVRVVEAPWGSTTFADGTALAKTIRTHEVDVLIAGPVTRLGMDEAGTLQQVRDFLKLVHHVREECERRLTVILIHHEAKGGKVSGAWEGSGDTLIHLEVHAQGHTEMHVKKARWSSEHHEKKMKLAWTDGEGFDVEEERDYVNEIEVLLRGGKLSGGAWKTVTEIANKKGGGIGAGRKTVEKMLKERPDIFQSCEGDEVGRSSKAVVWSLVSAERQVGTSGQVG